MSESPRTLLEAIEAATGEPTAVPFDAVYDQLRRLAESYLRAQRPGHTLQPTALVHEAYIKMASSGSAYRDREHFCAVAATAMRQVLVSHARERGSQKRGGGWDRIPLDAVSDAMREGGADPLELDDALTRLAALDERQAHIAELRIFGALSHDAIAGLLGLAPSTVKEDWAFARAWLKRELLGV